MGERNGKDFLWLFVGLCVHLPFLDSHFPAFCNVSNDISQKALRSKQKEGKEEERGKERGKEAEGVCVSAFAVLAGVGEITRMPAAVAAVWALLVVVVVVMVVVVSGLGLAGNASAEPQGKYTSGGGLRLDGGVHLDWKAGVMADAPTTIPGGALLANSTVGMPWNMSNVTSTANMTVADELPEGFAFTIMQAAACVVWILFIAFYSTRCIGFVVTKFLQWQLRLRDAGIFLHVGSLSISPIAGRIVFRDIRFVTTSFAVTIVDGYFRITSVTCVLLFVCVCGFA